MIKAYQEGMVAFKDQLYLEAAKKFNEAETLFPQSKWAPRSALMAAYAYYYDDYNNRAILELKIFLKNILMIQIQLMLIIYLLCLIIIKSLMKKKI
jgi:outer membrane protein assembly factor BamD